MDIAQTSIDSYHAFSMSELGEKQRVILAFIRKYGPISNKQLALMTGWPINSITPRVLELREMQLVEYAGEGIDMETNRHVMLWSASRRVQ